MKDVEKEKIIEGIIYKCKVEKRRKYRGEQFARFIWNLYHPEDLVTKGDGFVIHHIDGNALNDIIENLQKLTPSAHSILHNTKREVSEESKQRMSKAQKGKKHSEITLERQRIARLKVDIYGEKIQCLINTILKKLNKK